MNIYKIGIAAARFSGRGMELDVRPVEVSSDNEPDALDAALVIAKSTWPEKLFWTGHTAVCSSAFDTGRGDHHGGLGPEEVK